MSSSTESAGVVANTSRVIASPSTLTTPANPPVASRQDAREGLFVDSCCFARFGESILRRLR